MRRTFFRTNYSDRTMRTINTIIKTEDLSVSVDTYENAIGDTMIEVYGTVAEIRILKEVYAMVF